MVRPMHLAVGMDDTGRRTSSNEVNATASEQSMDRERDARLATLHALETGARYSIEALHNALCAYVRVRRRDGDTVEAVLAQVRELVIQPVTPEGATRISPLAREALIDLSLRWCADEFARAD
jgi:hypothetical protein